MRVIETGAREVATLRYSPDGTVLTLLSREPVDAGGYAAVLVPTAALALALHGTRWSWRIAVGGFPLVAVVLGACSAPGG